MTVLKFPFRFSLTQTECLKQNHAIQLTMSIASHLGGFTLSQDPHLPGLLNAIYEFLVVILKRKTYLLIPLALNNPSIFYALFSTLLNQSHL